MLSNPACPHCSASETIFKEKVQLWECQTCDERFEELTTKIIGPQTIFLSYAHKSEKLEDYDVSEDLALLIKVALEKDGHTVWIDKDRIKAGHNWRESITRAILTHDHFLSFLSKRSVRDPGVCLNEIAIALDKGVNFQTVLTEPEGEVQPPITVTDTQWHQFVGWQEAYLLEKSSWDAWFEERMKGIRVQIEDYKNARAPGELTILRRALDPKTFNADIAKKTEGFFGRTWLFDAYDQWLGKTNDRVFWIKGTPGIGKSSFAAKLVHQSKSQIMGFFKCEFQSSKSPEEAAKEVVCTLAYQLATRMPDYRSKLLYGLGVNNPEIILKKTANELFSFLITEPLDKRGKIAESQRSAFVIDALDEAGRNDGTNPLLNMIKKHAPNLPDWLGIVITSRPEGYIVQELADIEAHDMSGDTQQNKDDLRNYLDLQLDPKVTGDERVKTLSQITAKSGGAFLYISQILHDQYDLTKPDLLPEGINGYFMENFRRYFKDASEYGKETEPFLELMVASPGPLPKALGQAVLKWTEREVTLQVTEPMGSLLQGKDGGLIFFHQSLPDWLRDAKRSGRYQVNPDGAKKLGEFLWKEFENTQLIEDGKTNNNSTEEQSSKEILQLRQGPWELQIIYWLAELLPSTDQWRQRQLLDKFSDYLHASLNYQGEQVIRQRHLLLTELEFGVDSAETSDSLNAMGELLAHLDRFKDAEWILRRSLQIREKLFGSNHPFTATSLSNLGYVLSNLCLYEDAEALSRSSLEIRERILGPNHPDTAQSLNNLGILLNTVGRSNDAELNFRRSLEVQKKVDPQSSETARALNNLGALLALTGRHDEAEHLYRQALEIRLKVLGSRHPDVANSSNNLGVLLVNTGRLDEAEPLMRQALEISEAIFGSEHASTADALYELSSLLIRLEVYDEAETFSRKSLYINEKVFGLEHPKTKDSLNNLAILLSYLGRHDEAEPLYRRALSIAEKLFGPDHPEIIDSLDNLGGLLSDLARYVEAEAFFRRTLAIREKNFGQNDSSVGHALFSLGQCLGMQKHIDEAQECYLREIDIIEKNEGLGSHSLVLTFRTLGVTLKNANRFSEAEFFLEKALYLAETNQKHSGDEVNAELSALGRLRLRQARYQEAEDLFLRSLRIEESAGDQEGIDATRQNLHELYLAWGQP